MRSTDLRQRLARESARLMAQECIADFQTAKAKAAARLGVPLRHLPSNSEIEEALAEYQRLFRADSLPGRLRELRLAALQAMRLFKHFNPRLAGPVLSGSIHPHTEIVLHLFTDTPEEIAWFLMERHIPYQLKEHLYQAGPERGQRESYPCYRFMAGQESITLEVFPVDGIRRAPPSPVDGKPMRRADMQAVEGLLAEN